MLTIAKIVLTIVVFIPFVSKAAIYYTLSGAMVEADHPIWVEQVFTTLSGEIVKVLVRKAKAEYVENVEKLVIFAEMKRLALELDLDWRRIDRLIQCESGYNPKALNQMDIDNLQAYGLLQFKKSTFKNAGGKDIWDWREQLDIGLKMMSEGYWYRWPVCSGSVTYEDLVKNK